MATELVLLILLVISILLIGFFSGMEIAFVSASRLNIELKKKQGKNSGIILSRFMEHPSQFISTCLAGYIIFLVAYGLLFSLLLTQTLWNPFRLTNEYVKKSFDVLLAVFIILVFGRVIPKAIFRARNDGLLGFFAPVIHMFYTLLHPVAVFFGGIAEWILKYIFNIRVKERANAFTKTDLDHFYHQNREADDDAQDLNTELFENALQLPSVKIRQCLVPRTEVEAVDINTTVSEVTRRFIQTKLSKIVVYKDNIDNILGYVHQLDLFKKPATIKDVLLPIPAVPESMSATDLINKFTKERKSIAWVVDEFGGTSGIITMEDVLEEIFGEIHDEYDTEEFVEKQIAENEYILSGRLELDYINEKYDFNFPDNESETLSGYIIDHHEKIPSLKERIILGRYEFDILSVSDTRIEMVKLKVLR